MFIALVNADPSSGSYWSNELLIFDCRSPTDSKYAGILIGRRQFEIGHRTASGLVGDVTVNVNINGGVDYTLSLSIDGSRATATFNGGVAQLAFDFGEYLTDGSLGLGTNNARAHFDSVVIQ